MAQRYLSKAALESHHGLEGLQLASPRRRLAAFLLDALILLVPSVLVTLAVAIGALALFHPSAYEVFVGAFESGGDDPQTALRQRATLGRLLVETDALGVPVELIQAVEEGDDERAAAIVSEYEISIGLSASERESVQEGELHLEVRRLIPRGLRSLSTFGVAALYYVFFLSGSRRATPGKRLLRLEVLKLDGKPLSAWEAFERFGGYLASLGTLGLGLVDFWRDPNRRLAHDRIAQTVVVRRARRV